MGEGLTSARRAWRWLAPLFYILWIGGTWLATFVAIGLLVERSFNLFLIPRIIIVVTAALAIVHSAAQSFGPRFAVERYAKQQLTMGLGEVLAIFAEAERTHWGLRANIMKLRGSELGIVAQVGMTNQREVGLRWDVTQGCCGLAVREQAPVLGDLNAYRGRPYATLRDPEDGLPRWGIAEHQWELVRDVGCVMSWPLFAPGTSTVVGVLNVDSTAGRAEGLSDAVEESLLRRVQVLHATLAHNALQCR